MATVRELLTKIGFVFDKSGLRQAEAGTEKIKRELEKTGRAGVQAGKTAANGLRQISSAANESTSNINRMVDAGIAFGTSIKSVMRQAREEIRNTSNRMANYYRDNIKGATRYETGMNLRSKGRDIAAAGAESMAMGTAMLAPLYVPVKAAMDFESGMAEIRKVVEMTDEESRKMAEDIIELSRRVPVAVEGLQAIVAAGGQSGIAKSDLLEFAETAAKMGVAFDMSMDDAGRDMAAWRAAMSLSQKQVEALGDQINELGNNTNARSKDISNFMSRIGATAKVAGIDIGDTAAFGASLIATKTDPEEAATTFKNILLSLSAPTTLQAKAIEELGFSTEEMAKRLKYEGAPAILDVLKAIKQVEPHRQMDIIDAIFQRVGTPGVSKMLENLDAVEANLQLVGDKATYAGSMQKEFDQRASTTEYSVEKLTNEIKALNKTLGDGFLPVIQDIVKILSPVINGFAEFAKNNPKLTTGILLVVAAIGGLLVVLGGIGVIVGGLMSLWGALVAFAGTGIGAMVIAAAPWIAALVVIGGLLYAIYTHWDEIVDFIKTHATAAWETLKSVATECLNTIVGWLETAIKKAKEFAAALKGSFMDDRIREMQYNTVDEWGGMSGAQYVTINQENRVEGYTPEDAATYVNNVTPTPEFD